MDIEYSLTLKDVEAFARYHRKHGPWRKAHRLSKVLLWSLVFGFPLALLTQFYPFFGPKLPAIDIKSWIAFWGGFIVGFLFVILLELWQGKMIVQSTRRLHDNEEARWIFAPKRMTIRFDGFTVTSEYERTAYCWPVICRLGATDDHAFFYITRINAHIVPRRAFADKQQFEEFIALARQYQEGRGQQEPKSTSLLAGLPPESSAITRRDVP